MLNYFYLFLGRKTALNIQTDPHTLLRAEERGANREEILQVLKTGQEIPAKFGKLCKYKIFDFKKK